MLTKYGVVFSFRRAVVGLGVPLAVLVLTTIVTATTTISSSPTPFFAMSSPGACFVDGRCPSDFRPPVTPSAHTDQIVLNLGLSRTVSAAEIESARLILNGAVEMFIGTHSIMRPSTCAAIIGHNGLTNQRAVGHIVALLNATDPQTVLGEYSLADDQNSGLLIHESYPGEGMGWGNHSERTLDVTTALKQILAATGPAANVALLLQYLSAPCSFNQLKAFATLVVTLGPPPGEISVTTNLEEATFTVNGPRATAGSGTSLVLSDAPAGEYTATFNRVAGFKTPPPQTGVLGGGGTLTFDGTYARYAPPTITLLPDDSFPMASPYSLRAQVINNTDAPVSLTLDWQEGFDPSQPTPVPPERNGSKSLILQAGEHRTVEVAKFWHKWDWIGPNPIHLLADLLNTGTESLSLEALKQFAELIKGGQVPSGAVLQKALGALSLLIDGLRATTIQMRPDNTIFYEVRPRWSVDGSALSEMPPLQKETHLFVPEHKKFALGRYSVSAIYGYGLYSVASSLLFAPGGSGIAPSAPFIFAGSQAMDLAKISYDIARDPARYDFTDVAAPARMFAAAIGALPPSDSKNLADAMDDLHALVVAERIAMDRADGAFELADAYWQSVQIAAARNYALASAEASTRMIDILIRMAPALAATLAAQQVDIPFLLTQGLPEPMASTLQTLGWSAEDVALLREALVTAPHQASARPLVDAAKLSAFLSAGIAGELTTIVTSLRVDQLAEVVRPLPQEQLEALDERRGSIVTALEAGPVSMDTLQNAKTLAREALRLLDETNNWEALKPYVDIALQAQASYQVGVIGDDAPVLLLPDDMVAEAQGLETSVLYTVSAHDETDGAVQLLCAPESGAMFPFGTTRVNCVSTDSQGNSANGGFLVTVSDTTPPALTLPGSIWIEATWATGARPTWPATAVDLVDGGVPVNCSPASRALLPIGTHTVTCSSEDGRGNRRVGTFVIEVVDPTTVGLMTGDTRVTTGDIRYDLTFRVRERATGTDRGNLRLTIETRRRGPDGFDRFVADADGMKVVFRDDPAFRPGRGPRPTFDSVSITGSGRWNGSAARFEIDATDRGEPGKGKDTLVWRVYDGSGQTVALVDTTLTNGNIQSNRVRR